jgi:hypothetical protein
MDASSKSSLHTPGQLLTQNTQLSSKLSSLLPAGTDLQAAAAGFRNLGQFVAAVHVSHNLDIPFDQLKCTELATTAACPGMAVPSKGSHLGQAIQTLKPAMSSAEPTLTHNHQGSNRVAWPAEPASPRINCNALPPLSSLRGNARRLFSRH